ncbi:MAG TPA: pseudouridine synthase [Fibrobacteria bacterium]|nr:pseudouridine synthase [Fibrobacteria bacterium]
MRINRYLALCGFGSRRAVEDLIRGGAVAVDGEIVYDLARRIGEDDKVKVLGKAAVPPREHEYVMLNKPKGYLCSASDPFERPTIYKLMPAAFRKLHYVGRLDYNSRGLILLTNEGGLTHSLLHPSREVPRTYRVWTRKPLAAKDIKRLLSGVDIGFEDEAVAVSVKAVRDHTEIVLKEGKNREIRRMLEVVGYRVVDLQRIRFGSLELGDLPEGEYRRLSASEISRLHGKKTA